MRPTAEIQRGSADRRVSTAIEAPGLQTQNPAVGFHRAGAQVVEEVRNRTRAGAPGFPEQPGVVNRPPRPIIIQGADVAGKIPGRPGQVADHRPAAGIKTAGVRRGHRQVPGVDQLPPRQVHGIITRPADRAAVALHRPVDGPPHPGQRTGQGQGAEAGQRAAGNSEGDRGVPGAEPGDLDRGPAAADGAGAGKRAAVIEVRRSGGEVQKGGSRGRQGSGIAAPGGQAQGPAVGFHDAGAQVIKSIADVTGAGTPGFPEQPGVVNRSPRPIIIQGAGVGDKIPGRSRQVADHRPTAGIKTTGVRRVHRQLPGVDQLPPRQIHGIITHPAERAAVALHRSRNRASRPVQRTGQG